MSLVAVVINMVEKVILLNNLAAAHWSLSLALKSFMVAEACHLVVNFGLRLKRDKRL